MQKTAPLLSSGFTLVELLVVISIMSILSVVGLLNIKDFKPDQDLRSEAFTLQTLLQEARSNAKNGLTCDSSDPSDWRVHIEEGLSSLTLSCTKFTDGVTVPKKTMNFNPTISVSSVNGSTPSCTAYELLYKKSQDQVEFVGAPSINCPSNITSLDISLINSVNSGTKTVTVDSGGSIYVPK